MANDQFEVYYFQSGRWHVHASFEGGQREVAIEEAKNVETNLGFPARVIRETYYPESNSTEEIVTYQGQKAKSIADADTMFGPGKKSGGPAGGGAGSGGSGPAKRQRGTGAGSGGGRGSNQPSARSPRNGSGVDKTTTGQKGGVSKKRRRNKKLTTIVVQILTGLIMSLIIAVIGSLAIIAILSQMLDAGLIPAGNRNALVFGTFFILFFGSVFLYLNKHFNILRLVKKSRSPKRGPKRKTAPLRSAEPVDLEDLDLDELSRRITEKDNVPLGPSEVTETGFESEDTEEKEKKEGKKKKASEKNNKKQAEKGEEEDEEEEEEEEEEKELPAKTKKDPEKKKGPADAIKPDFLEFLTDAVTSIQKEHPQLNTFSKFGMNLYISGACSAICQKSQVPNEDMLSLLRDSLGIIGTNKQRAQSFCDDIPTYGSNPRYSSMIQAGGQAMSSFLGGQSTPNSGLSPLLTEWNLPEKRSAVPTMFTFVFTDIVGSTAMTQRLGNAGAQKAVRAHNDAVRGAIQKFSGREVKHTGDGIMATFPDDPSAVAASIEMLKSISAHNKASPDGQVEIRVGINTGEAVEEENDFFGQAVQMTARICDKAADGHAWVSEVVADACKGQKFGFLPRGKFEMKGIERPKPLFEIAWTDAHRDELADL